MKRAQSIQGWWLAGGLLHAEDSSKSLWPSHQHWICLSGVPRNCRLQHGMRLSCVPGKLLSAGVQGYRRPPL